VAQYAQDQESQFIEKVVAVNRTAKVVKGGRRYAFSALVVVGDGKGNVGLGFGKANEVTDAIGKALNDGRRSMQSVPLYRTTIPYAVSGTYKGGKVLLKPATSGTGVIAGGAVRAVLEAAGIRDVLSKSLGSNNPVNVAKATMDGLLQLMTVRAAFDRRGIKLAERQEPEEEAAEPAGKAEEVEEAETPAEPQPEQAEVPEKPAAETPPEPEAVAAAPDAGDAETETDSKNEDA
jgi:small subunit ribosomal protein S5